MMMELESTRFGKIQIEADEALRFPAGLVGLENCRDWVVLTDAASTTVAWLQSIERPELALAVVNPRCFVPDYQVRLARREWAPLGLETTDAAEVLVIVGKSAGAMVLNLKAPLIVNVDRRVGRQVVANGDLPLDYPIQNVLPSTRKIA